MRTLKTSLALFLISSTAIAGGNTTTQYTGNLTGNVTGNVMGNVTGNVIGNVTGSVTGHSSLDLQASSNLSDVANAQTAINNLFGAQTSGYYCRSNGTNTLLAAIQAADVPTLNQNTTGTASNVTGTVTETHGGTNQTSYTKGDELYASASNTISKLPIGTQGQVRAVSTSGVSYWSDRVDPSTIYCEQDDFGGPGLITGSMFFGDTPWLDGVSGTGATISATAAATSSANPGIAELQAGTTTSGFAVIRKAINTVFGGGSHYLEALLRIPTLSTGTNTFNARFGWTDTNAGTDATNAAYWVYNPALTFTCSSTSTNSSTSITNLGSCSGVIDPSSIQVGMSVTDSLACFQANTTVSVAPGAGTSLTLNQATNGSGCGSSDTLTFTVGNFFIAKNIKASSKSVQVTTQAVSANTFYKPEITVNAAGTSVVYAMNGSTLATIATNVPAVAVGPEFVIVETAGTAGTSFVDVDYYKRCFVPTTAR